MNLNKPSLSTCRMKLAQIMVNQNINFYALVKVKTASIFLLGKTLCLKMVFVRRLNSFAVKLCCLLNFILSRLRLS